MFQGMSETKIFSTITVTALATTTDDHLSETENAIDNEEPNPSAKSHSWTRIEQIWSDTWTIEIAATAVCLTCASAICIVLGVFDNKPIPTLPKGLTMNTVIAVFSTIAKSSLLLVISSCISQLKWRWYRQSRKLNQIQLFDNASRGPLGALQMLFYHRVCSVACIGAAILVLGLLFEPFVQQSLAYTNILSLQPIDTAVVKQSRAFFPNTSAPFSAGSNIPDSVYQAAYVGLWSSDSLPLPQCPSPYSDCAWDTFSSLELCHSCGKADLSHKIECNLDVDLPMTPDVNQKKMIPCNLTFGQYSAQQIFVESATYHRYDSNEASVAFNFPAYAMFQLGSPDNQWGASQQIAHHLFRNDTVQGLKDPLFAFQIVAFNTTNNSLVVTDVDECAVGFCLRDYAVSVKNNTPQVNVSNVRYGTSFTPPQEVPYASAQNRTFGYCWMADGEVFVPNPSMNVSTCYYSDSSGCVDIDEEHFSFCAYVDAVGFQSSWQEAITSNFWSNVTTGTDTTICGEGAYGRLSQCDANDSSLLGSFPSLDSLIEQGSDAIVKRVYKVGMGTILQNILDHVNLLNRGTCPTWVKGKAGNPTPHIHVRWAWLSLPFVLVIAGTAILVWTMVDTGRNQTPLWKGSTLALLFHGLEPDALKDRDVPETTSGMETLAETISSTLQFSDSEGRRVLKSGNDAHCDSGDMVRRARHRKRVRA